MEQHPHRAGIAAVIILVLVIAGTVWYVAKPDAPLPATPGNDTSTQRVSDGMISLTYSSATFDLTTKPEQIVTTSYIPACSEPFNYCLYYNDQSYKGTNFESAGLRIQKRTDLTTEAACLTTPPEGYDANFKPAATERGDNYKTSAFWPLSDAGAGHFANGELYRLSYTGTAPGANTSTAIRAVSCYEFETRIGMTQFGNYPAGSIREFTNTDKIAVQLALRDILDHIKLPLNTPVTFPNPTNRTVQPE